jgi:NAD+ synthase (glutamine-hydrolysing)
MIHICLAQLNVKVADIDNNTKKITQAINQARQKNADLIVFPELALCGYPPEDLLLRDDFHARIEQAIQHLCTKTTGIDVLLGTTTQKNGRLFNSALWIRDQKIIGTYHKQKRPNTGLFDEKRYFTSGKNTSIIALKGIQFGVLICEDLWYEQPILHTKNAGAQCILSLNASPFHDDKQNARINIMQQRIAETALPIIYTNLVGGQDEFLFDGHSCALNRQGELAMSAPPFEEGLFYLTLDKDANITPQPIKDYDKLANIYNGLVLATRDYLQKNHFSGAIIGLSGGIDSALTLAIAADAIGAEQVHAIMMPSRYTADISLEDAKKQAETLGAHYEIIPIKPMFDTFLHSLSPSFKGLAPDQTEENIQARIRGTLLMALSNKTGNLVLTTSNKSEMAVGYATLYGDMAGGFAVLKDVYKTLVYQLAHYRNTLSPVIPTRVITRAPSAELAHDQLDQDSLPAYDVLDAIIKDFVENDLSPEQISAKGFDAKIVSRITKLIQINEYKRRQSPPGARITKKSFGRNRRYPITSGFLQ